LEKKKRREQKNEQKLQESESCVENLFSSVLKS